MCPQTFPSNLLQQYYTKFPEKFQAFYGSNFTPYLFFSFGRTSPSYLFPEFTNINNNFIYYLIRSMLIQELGIGNLPILSFHSPYTCLT